MTTLLVSQCTLHVHMCTSLIDHCEFNFHTVGLFPSVLEDQRMTLLAPTHKFFTCLVDG